MQALPGCSLESFAAEPQLALLVACAVYCGRAALVHSSAAWPLQAAQLQAPLCCMPLQERAACRCGRAAVHFVFIKGRLGRWQERRPYSRSGRAAYIGFTILIGRLSRCSIACAHLFFCLAKNEELSVIEPFRRDWLLHVVLTIFRVQSHLSVSWLYMIPKSVTAKQKCDCHLIKARLLDGNQDPFTGSNPHSCVHVKLLAQSERLHKRCVVINAGDHEERHVTF